MDVQEEYNSMMDSRKSSGVNRKLITIAIIAFVLGFLASWMWSNRDGASDVRDNDSAKEDEVMVLDNGDGSVMVSGVNSVEVLDQAPGRVVQVGSVVLEKTGWVVVRENNDGQIGNILGAKLFLEGESAGEVELLRGTVEGGTYYASLYNEDSDLEENREFDLEKDLPLVDADGSPIQVKFKASSSPE